MMQMRACVYRQAACLFHLHQVTPSFSFYCLAGRDRGSEVEEMFIEIIIDKVKTGCRCHEAYLPPPPLPLCPPVQTPPLHSKPKLQVQGKGKRKCLEVWRRREERREGRDDVLGENTHKTGIFSQCYTAQGMFHCLDLNAAFSACIAHFLLSNPFNKAFFLSFLPFPHYCDTFYDISHAPFTMALPLLHYAIASHQQVITSLTLSFSLSAWPAS